MTLHSLSAWLRCPHCASELVPQLPLTLLCQNGHSFDANKRGFVNLLASNNRMIGDSPAMLEARAAFLDAGHFAPILSALRAQASAVQLRDSPARVIEAGCGTGYYLSGVVDALGAETKALAMDISPHAVARAVRSTSQQCDGLVADTWRPLPIRDSAADLLMTVFAPRNLAEFSRVLAPGGALLVVVPTAEHISELRDDGRAIGIPAEKAERLAAEAESFFELSSRERVEYRINISAVEAAQLLDMGPSAHHSAAEARTESDEPELMVVTVSVDVLTFRKQPARL